MGTVVRKIASLVLVGIIAYVGYLAYVRWWDGPTLQTAKDRTQEFFTKKADEARTAVEEKTEEYADQVVSEAKQTALGYVKEKISEGMSSMGDSLLTAAGSLIGASTTPLSPLSVKTIAGSADGILMSPTGASYATPPQPASLITKVGTPLIFSINRGATYVINWGDSGTENGKVENEQVKLVSHAWRNEGDYLISISVEGGGVSQKYTFPVRVYP